MQDSGCSFNAYVQSYLCEKGHTMDADPIVMRISRLLEPYNASIQRANNARYQRPRHVNLLQRQHQPRPQHPPQWRAPPHKKGATVDSGRRRDRGRVPTATIPPSSRIKKTKTDDSFFVGALNRLNTSNYKKVREQVKAQLATCQLWVNVVHLVLKQCSTQQFFVPVYVQLIDDIVDSCPSSTVRQDVFTVLEDYVKEYIGTLLVHIAENGINEGEEGHLNLTEEDRYCGIVKRKARVSGMNRTVLRIKTDRISPSSTLLQGYSDTMHRCLSRVPDHETLIFLMDLCMETRVVHNNNTPCVQTFLRTCMKQNQERAVALGTHLPQYSRYRLHMMNVVQSNKSLFG